MDVDVTWAEELAREMLADALPRRWAHSQGVARQARRLRERLGPDADLLEASAWTHDVGYTPTVALTGFHPLDGARHLRKVGAPDLLCRLVAYHSSAVAEAQERGLSTELADEFEPPTPLLLQALTACDMTTTPTGEQIDATRRVAEVLERYAPDDPVHRVISRVGGDLIAAAEAVFGDEHRAPTDA